VDPSLILVQLADLLDFEHLTPS
ncbi:MAG: hypothetical protein K0Q73_6277, partial [Paenibacillus sp.]|nr:hypothetical protein [Paenibacillus sp.]